MTTTQITTVERLPYVERDTYKGTWDLSAGQATKRGFRPQEWAVDDLHAILPQGELTAIWESYGTCRDGQEHFGRSRIRCDRQGIALYASDGHLVITYPLARGRTIRILVK